MTVIPIYTVPQVANIFDMGLEARIHMIISSVYGRSHFTIFRHSTNTFDFLIRDIDRQPKVQTGTVEILIYNDRNDIILTIPLTVQDADRAHYRATISTEQSSNIELGYYTWVVRHVDGTTRLLYTNQHYETKGTLVVKEGIPQPIHPSVTIDSFTPEAGTFITSSLPAINQTGNHSIATTMTDYTGSIIVEATHDANPTIDDWVEVETFIYTAETGIVNENFIGNYTYVRFVISNEGVTSLTYRN
jgi:hypothetical protein